MPRAAESSAHIVVESPGGRSPWGTLVGMDALQAFRAAGQFSVRTRDLRETNARLEQTTRQLVLSEKLAAVGEITADLVQQKPGI